MRVGKGVGCDVGAGLGGGSSDAATALLLLNDVWEINAPLEALAELAAPLGADVPACLYRKPLHMSGIGHDLHALPKLHCSGAVLLINPGEPVATPVAYQRYADSAPAYRTPLTPPQRTDFSAQHNDLQHAAIAVCPRISEVLAQLNAQRDCRLARLCGSGATCFGLFDTNEQASAALANIRKEKPDWWVQLTTLL